MSDDLSKEKKTLDLPKKLYEPFFLKVMHDFIEYHKITKDLPFPTTGLIMHKSMSYILDIMVHSMGDQKREEILKELEEYKSSLPFDLR